MFFFSTGGRLLLMTNMKTSLFFWSVAVFTVAVDGRVVQHKRSADTVTTSDTTVSTSTSAPSGCVFDVKFYRPGEYIYQSLCFSIRCGEDGEVIFDGVTCPEGCAALAAMQPHNCCRPCQYGFSTEPTFPTGTTPGPEETSPPETTRPSRCEDDGTCSQETTTTLETSTLDTTTTQLPGCWESGRYYELHEYIYRDHCYAILCTYEGAVVNEYVFCPTSCEALAQMQPNDCCTPCYYGFSTEPTFPTGTTPGPEETSPPETTRPSRCEDGGTCSQETTTTLETSTLDTTTTQLPGCWESGRYYEPLEYLYKEPCYSAQCSFEGQIIYGDIFCPNTCEAIAQMPPNDCCKPCPVTTTTTESPSSSVETSTDTLTETSASTGRNSHQEADKTTRENPRKKKEKRKNQRRKNKKNKDEK